MWADKELVVFAIAIVVQLAGFASVAIARVGQRSESHGHQRFFYACLLLVALFALIANLTGTGSWLMNGTTLAMMALGVTIDKVPTEKTDYIL